MKNHCLPEAYIVTIHLPSCGLLPLLQQGRGGHSFAGSGQLGKVILTVALLHFCMAVFSSISFAADAPELRTLKPGPAPHINGPSIFGARPGAPFLYRIPASGERPIKFEVSHLPSGLHLDSKTGEIRVSL